MKEKLKNIRIRLWQAVRKNPVEGLLALLFGVGACCYYETREPTWENLLYYAPVLFLTTYTLNRLTAAKKGRWLYYLSGLFFVPFYMTGWDRCSPTYLVSLAVVQLVYLIAGWERENRSFVGKGLTYLKAGIAAGLLALIAWLLAVSIYSSVCYIFEVGDGSDKSRFISYALAFCCGTLMPLLFLVFNEDKVTGTAGNKVFEVLLNFVLSPALLIYAAILYLYFLKIAVLWSLPKGAVAYIVVSFVAGGFLLKGCQIFLARRWYDWFYNRLSLAVLPALAMYWAGACFRIRQYGFTEARVYLIVVGVILTGMALLFFSRRTGRYLYVAVLAAALLSAVTYIPGITASDIERISQAGRPADLSPWGETAGGSVDYIGIWANEPIDIRGYATLQPADNYNSGDKGIWTDYRSDSFFVRQGKDRVLLGEQTDSLLYRQLRRAGVAHGDTIPVCAYQALLTIELDSACFIIESMSLEQTVKEGKASYRVNFMNGGYCLKR